MWCMEKNIISYSNNINILNLLSNILSNYDVWKENIIGFSFDDEDLLYILSLGYIYLDSNNELTRYKIDLEPPYEFEEYTKTENKEFNLRDYVETKFYDFKKILTSFNIEIDWELCYEFIPWDYVTDDMWDEVIIEKPVQKFYFKISVNIQDLKNKMLEYLKNEIVKKKFHYSIEKIEKDILSKFDEFWKSEIIISDKSLGDKLNSWNKYYPKVTYNKDDLITIVYYNDILELFLYKLYCEWILNKWYYLPDWNYEISLVIKKENKLDDNTKVIKNIEDNKVILLDWKIIYYKDKYLFQNPIDNNEYNIMNHWDYDKMMDILIHNIWYYVSYKDFNSLNVYKKQWDSRTEDKRITDTKDNLIKNVVKKLLKSEDWKKTKFIIVKKWLKLCI